MLSLSFQWCTIFVPVENWVCRFEGNSFVASLHFWVVCVNIELSANIADRTAGNGANCMAHHVSIRTYFVLDEEYHWQIVRIKYGSRICAEVVRRIIEGKWIQSSSISYRFKELE